MDNDFLMMFLVEKLNQEMKNILKKGLTTENKNDIINVSNEREELKNEKEILLGFGYRNRNTTICK